ncbi:hypothetical protein D3C86_1676930 [compost metagenome]
MGRLFHHRAGRRDRVTGAGQARYGAGGAVDAVHHGGVQFVLAGGGEDRAASGVEQGVVFHGLNCGLNRVQRRAASGQHRRTGVQRRLQAGAIGGVAFRRQLGALDDARAAVDGQRPGRRVFSLG